MTQNEIIRLVSLETGYSPDKIKKTLRKITKYLCVALETDGELKMSFGNIHLRKSKVKEVQHFGSNTRYKIAPRYKIEIIPSIYVKKSINKMNLLEQERYEAAKKISPTS